MSSEKEGEEVVSVKVREEYMVSLLRELYGLVGKYYIDVFEKEEASMSPVYSIVDLRKSLMRKRYFAFYDDLLFWSRFLETKSIMRRK